MIGAVIGDTVGSVYEFNNRTEDHENRTRAGKPTSIGN